MIIFQWSHMFVAVFTHKQLEMYEYILSTVATDVLVLKHQAISIHSVDKRFIIWDQFLESIIYR